MVRLHQSTRMAAALLVVLALTACDRPNLEPDAVPVFNRLEAVRIINDVGDGAIAANEAGQLSDAITAQVLTVGWQVRDYIEANPQTTYSRIVTAIREGLQAAPAELQTQVARYFETAIAALEKLQAEVQ